MFFTGGCMFLNSAADGFPRANTPAQTLFISPTLQIPLELPTTGSKPSLKNAPPKDTPNSKRTGTSFGERRVNMASHRLSPASSSANTIRSQLVQTVLLCAWEFDTRNETTRYIAESSKHSMSRPRIKKNPK